MRRKVATKQVDHPSRGRGRIVRVLASGGKPCRVRFEAGDVHDYSLASMRKMRIAVPKSGSFAMDGFRAVADATDLQPGAVVAHEKRGRGTIVRVLDGAKPYRVRYANGEVKVVLAISSVGHEQCWP